MFLSLEVLDLLGSTRSFTKQKIAHLIKEHEQQHLKFHIESFENFGVHRRAILADK